MTKNDPDCCVQSDEPRRCPDAGPDGQCGLIAGHSEWHTLLIPSGMPWSTKQARKSRRKGKR